MIGLGLLLAVGISGACHPVESEKILGRDLIAAVPGMALPGDVLIGYAPAPGAKRVFTAEELKRIAAVNGTSLDVTEDICFEWALELPSREEIVNAMRESLDNPDATIEIIDMSSVRAPKGRIVFPREGLSDAPVSALRSSVYWKGFVRYGEKGQFDIWARAGIRVRGSRVTTVSPLRSGEPIRPEQVRLEVSDDLPLANGVATNLHQVVGRLPRKAIPAGFPVQLNLLENTKEVSKGDLVRVEVRNGATHLVLEARAETSGRVGEAVLMRNISSGRPFQAHVVGPGEVSVTVGSAPVVKYSGDVQ